MALKLFLKIATFAGASPTAEGLIKSESKPAAVQINAVRPKQQLLYLADVLGFQVQFTDFPKVSLLNTGHNEVVAKGLFLQVCVCPQGGRVSASVHAGMPDPPRPSRHPPGPKQTPPGTRQTPPGTRQIPPPGPGRPPSGPGRPPPPRD